MNIAITRDVSPSIGNYEVFAGPRRPIDLDLARQQHSEYEATLVEMGCQIVGVPELAEYPDSVFVEDIAVVLDELAIITRPGAESRRGEIHSIAKALHRYRPLVHIEPPATLDGGDVLRVGRTLYVGLSERTNEAAAQQVRSFTAPHEYEVVTVKVDGCLHLKSAATQVADRTLLFNREWIDWERMEGNDLIEIDPSEPYAANTLRVDNELMVSAAFPATAQRLEDRGISTRSVDVKELQKADGALTCCSLIFQADG